MKRKSIIPVLVPIIMMIVSIAVIGAVLIRYLTTPDEVVYTYVNPAQSVTEESSNESSEPSSGIKYVLEESSPLEVQEDIEKTTGESSDTGELEKLVEDINRQTSKQDVGDP